MDATEHRAADPVTARRSSIAQPRLPRGWLIAQALGSVGLAAVYGLCVFAWIVRGWAPLSTDDATYLIVGRNVLEGFGPTRFDHMFLIRSPLYPVLLALPGALGAPLLEAAHLQNVGWTLLGAAVAGILAARLWGWAPGVFAAALPLATPLAQQIGPTLRVDPLASLLVVLLVLLSTWLGRGSRSWWAIAVLAGGVLGLAILVKETTLVFAGLAVAIPLASRRPAVLVLRDALTGAAATLLTMSWWAIWHLQLVGMTPYLDVPPPLFVVMLSLAVAWLVGSWWMRERLADPAGGGGAATGPRSSVAMLIPWLIALGWSLSVVLGVAARYTTVRSALFRAEPFELIQTAGNPFAPWPIFAAIAVVAGALSIREPKLAVPALGLAAAVPLGWLTLALQNAPRNFLPASLLAAVGAAGCLAWLLERARWRRRSLRVATGQRSLAATGLLLATAGVSLAVLAVHGQPRARAAEDDLRVFAAEVQGMIPAGSPVLVSYGVAFGFEVDVGQRYDLRLLDFRRALVDRGSPTGLSLGLSKGGVISLGFQPARKRIRALQATVLAEAARGARFLVYGGDHDRGPSALTRLIEPATGFSKLLERPLGPDSSVTLYRIDPESVDLRGVPLASDPAAIELVLAKILRSSEHGEAALRCLFRDGLWVRGEPPQARLDRKLSRLGFAGRPDGQGTLYTGPPPDRGCVDPSFSQ